MPPPLSDQSQNFLLIQNPSQLAAWLGVSDKALRFILYKLDASKKYTSFDIRKRNGDSRRIDAPSAGLKYLQSTISKALVEVAPPRAIAKGYVKGLSIFDHAKIHRSRKWVVLADVDGFFPAINFGRVRGMFKSRPFSFCDEVATCLAQICCKDNELPQGSPASPSISNIICRRFDRELLELARAAKCSVSRYADDVCFSTNMKHISPSLAAFVPSFGYVPAAKLLAVFSRNGFKLKESKFRVAGSRDQKLVTGLVVNKGVSIPRRWKRQLRSALHVATRYGVAKSQDITQSWAPSFYRNGSSDFEQAIRGKIRYVHWVDRVAGRKVTYALHRNYPEVRGYIPRLKPAFPVRIMSEGESDLLHMEAALRSFNSGGKYLDLSPRFLNVLGGGGDVELWKTLQRIAKVDVEELTIGVFDCDNVPFLTKYVLGPGAYVKLGPMVYAICLEPPISAIPIPFCIEMLYVRSDATRKDSAGRRLFFRDEFDEATGLSLDGIYKREYPKSAALVLSEKVEVVGAAGASVLLGKVAFANDVHAATPPFENINFHGFVPTFDLIQSVVDDVVRYRI